MRLRAKVAIVTGAASESGGPRPTFCGGRAKVVVADIDSAGGEQTVSNIHSKAAKRGSCAPTFPRMRMPDGSAKRP